MFQSTNQYCWAVSPPWKSPPSKVSAIDFHPPTEFQSHGACRPFTTKAATKADAAGMRPLLLGTVGLLYFNGKSIDSIGKTTGNWRFTQPMMVYNGKSMTI